MTTDLSPWPARTSARGAISELAACTWFMERGFYVYRCQSPHAPFDLVAYRPGGPALRVEVKSATVNRRGHVSLRMPPPGHWDLLAVVGRDGAVLTFGPGATYTEVQGAVRSHYGARPAAA